MDGDLCGSVRLSSGLLPDFGDLVVLVADGRFTGILPHPIHRESGLRNRVHVFLCPLLAVLRSVRLRHPVGLQHAVHDSARGTS